MVSLLHPLYSAFICAATVLLQQVLFAFHTTPCCSLHLVDAFCAEGIALSV